LSRIAAFLLIAALGASSASAQTVMAVCNDPKGRGFETSPGRGWVFNRMKGSVLLFVRDRLGNPEILIRDPNRSASLARDGARLRITHHSRDYSYFIVTAIYQRAQVDTFQVTFLPNGRGKLVWSSVQSHLPPRDETKSSFMVADCSR
jgi:hypothetical protein